MRHLEERLSVENWLGLEFRRALDGVHGRFLSETPGQALVQVGGFHGAVMLHDRGSSEIFELTLRSGLLASPGGCAT